MSNGRPSSVFIKEKISLNIARMTKGGETFEIVIKDPDRALEFRQGKEIDPKEWLEVFEVWSDAKKGEKQSAGKMKQWLGTDEPVEAAQKILRKGEFHPTEEQRKRMSDAKRKKIMEYIHANAADPRTGAPHPLQRLELAFEQAKVHIDAYQTVEQQIEPILKQLRPIIPLSFEKATFTVVLPARDLVIFCEALKKKDFLGGEECQ